MTQQASPAFTRATKTQARLRLGLIGPAGAGKTYSALRVARALVGPEGQIAVIDTEHGSASKYADEFEFDVLELETYAPLTYVSAIQAAERAGYDVVVIDSLSHAWTGKEGALEQVDNAAARNKGNSYVAWRDVTPMHNALIDAMVGSRIHVIATMRSKTEYVLETVSGKQVPRKVGMAPVQRDGMEYEFDVVGDLDYEHRFIVSKTRCRALDGAVLLKPGEDLADTLRAWLTDGAPMPERPVAQSSQGAAPTNRAAPNGVTPPQASEQPFTARCNNPACPERGARLQRGKSGALGHVLKDGSICYGAAAEQPQPAQPALEAEAAGPEAGPVPEGALGVRSLAELEPRLAAAGSADAKLRELKLRLATTAGASR